MQYCNTRIPRTLILYCMNFTDLRTCFRYLKTHHLPIRPRRSNCYSSLCVSLMPSLKTYRTTEQTLDTCSSLSPPLTPYAFPALSSLGSPAGTSSPEESFVEYMRILFTDIGVMHSLLLELPPGHVVCHDWDKLGDKRQASKIAEFIAPNAFIAGFFAAALLETVSVHRFALSNTSTEPLPYEGAEAIVSRLQRKLDAFEALLCALPKQSF